MFGMIRKMIGVLREFYGRFFFLEIVVVLFRIFGLVVLME